MNISNVYSQFLEGLGIKYLSNEIARELIDREILVTLRKYNYVEDKKKRFLERKRHN